MDVDSVVAALLHDVIEDTPVTADELREAFGETVAKLVEGVSKLQRVKRKSKVDHARPERGAGREPAQDVPGHGR